MKEAGRILLLGERTSPSKMRDSGEGWVTGKGEPFPRSTKNVPLRMRASHLVTRVKPLKSSVFPNNSVAPAWSERLAPFLSKQAVEHVENA